jgi:hypothetical protein
LDLVYPSIGDGSGGKREFGESNELGVAASSGPAAGDLNFGSANVRATDVESDAAYRHRRTPFERYFSHYRHESGMSAGSM